MKRPARRGHVLIEVLVSGTVLAWALSGIVHGLVQGRASLATGLVQQQLGALAQQKVEQLTVMPSSGWITQASATVSESNVGGNTGWTRTTTFSAVVADTTSSLEAQPAPQMSAVITVTAPNGTSATRVARKWKAY